MHTYIDLSNLIISFVVGLIGGASAYRKRIVFVEKRRHTYGRHTNLGEMVDQFGGRYMLQFSVIM